MDKKDEEIEAINKAHFEKKEKLKSSLAAKDQEIILEKEKYARSEAANHAHQLQYDALVEENKMITQKMDESTQKMDELTKIVHLMQEHMQLQRQPSANNDSEMDVAPTTPPRLGPPKRQPAYNEPSPSMAASAPKKPKATETARRLDVSYATKRMQIETTDVPSDDDSANMEPPLSPKQGEGAGLK